MGERLKKKVSESLVTKTELLLPNDTNQLNNLMGGRLMHWMDIVAAISAQRHSNSPVVTASVDNVSFSKPIPLGNVITLNSKVTRAFKTSMEVFIEVWSENIPDGTKERTNSAFFTFVAVNAHNQPVGVPEAVPETKEERMLYNGAIKRREIRLVLANRLKPEEATELIELFNNLDLPKDGDH